MYLRLLSGQKSALDKIRDPFNLNLGVLAYDIRSKRRFSTKIRGIPFDSLPLHSATQKAIKEDFGYEYMSDVQKAVLETLEPTCDFLVRARTGTGKTLAFMIAALEQVLHKPDSFRVGAIPILVLSPTRELAIQIGKETEKLVKHHRLRVECAVGGTQRWKSVQTLRNEKVDILVATPGRLNDILKSDPLIRDKLSEMKVLIFDEADQLLEMGFKQEIEDILTNLPKEKSTYLFSATLSKEIRTIANTALRPNYKNIDTVPQNEIETHMKIRQSYIVIPYADQIYLVQDIIRKHRKSTPNSKIIIFCPITNQVILLSRLLNELPDMESLEIHAKLTQQQRTRISSKFRSSRSAVMCTTDVSARGVDYPGVTLVIQLGMPSNREQYIHRIGRTGRSDKNGEAILILSPFEQRYLECVSDLPIRKELRYIVPPNSRDHEIVNKIRERTAVVDSNFKNEVFMSFLGFHLSKLDFSRIRKDTVVEAASDFCKGLLGMDRIPQVSQKFAINMGIQGPNFEDGAIRRKSVSREKLKNDSKILKKIMAMDTKTKPVFKKVR